MYSIPIGAITIGVIFFVMKHPKQKDFSKLIWKERLVQLDLPGNALFMTTIVCLLLAIQWGGVKYNWGNARIIVLLILAFILAVSFVLLQIKLQEKATVPPRIFAVRSIWVGCIFIFFLAGAMFYSIYYLPIWFQAVQGVSAVQSGIRNLPLILSMTLGSMLSGGIITATGHCVPWMTAGASLVAIGSGLVSTFEPVTSAGAWIGYQIILGFGLGSAVQQTMLAAQAVLATRDIPTGTALMIFAQTLGGAVGVTIGQSIFSNQLLKNIIKEAPGYPPEDVITLGASHVHKGVPEKYVIGVTKTYNDAIMTAFYAGIAFAAVSTCASFGMEWVSVKKEVGGGKKGGIESGGSCTPGLANVLEVEQVGEMIHGEEKGEVKEAEGAEEKDQSEVKKKEVSS